MGLAQARQSHLAFHRQMVQQKAQRLTRGGGGGGLDPYGSAADKAKFNTHSGFDAGLDALRSSGLNQHQFSNLQAGHLPGGEHGMFQGMTPAQLKQVASFVNAQGTMTPQGAINPITGQQDSQMHFSYADPRIGHGESADEQGALPPWMQPPGGSKQFLGPLGGRPPMPPGGHPIVHGGMDRTDLRGLGFPGTGRPPINFPWHLQGGPIFPHPSMGGGQMPGYGPGMGRPPVMRPPAPFGGGMQFGQ